MSMFMMLVIVVVVAAIVGAGTGLANQMLGLGLPAWAVGAIPGAAAGLTAMLLRKRLAGKPPAGDAPA